MSQTWGMIVSFPPRVYRLQFLPMAAADCKELGNVVYLCLERRIGEKFHQPHMDITAHSQGPGNLSLAILKLTEIHLLLPLGLKVCVRSHYPAKAQL